MRRMLHLMVMLTVLWCGLHLAEPAHAHAGIANELAYAEYDSPPGEDDASKKAPANAAHTGHHHCPVATDARSLGADGVVFPEDAVLFALPVTALRSMSQAPPLDPPLA